MQALFCGKLEEQGPGRPTDGHDSQGPGENEVLPVIKWRARSSSKRLTTLDGGVPRASDTADTGTGPYSVDVAAIGSGLFLRSNPAPWQRRAQKV